MIISRNFREIPHEKINSKLTFLCFAAWLNTPWRFKERQVFHLILSRKSKYFIIRHWMDFVSQDKVRVMSNETEDFTESLHEDRERETTISLYFLKWLATLPRCELPFSMVPLVFLFHNSSYNLDSFHLRDTVYTPEFLTSMTHKRTDSSFDSREKKGSKNTVEKKFK